MKHSRLTLLASAMAFLFAFTAQAAMVKKMDLADLVGNADKVFRGQVVSKEYSNLAAGGGEIPTVTYVVQVADAMKGDFGGESKVELRMLTEAKIGDGSGTIQRARKLDLDTELEVGREYVLFTTQPSSIGLSTTVGLNQGLFMVFSNAQGNEITANSLNNSGLFQGPVSYDELKAAVLAELD